LERRINGPASWQILIAKNPERKKVGGGNTEGAARKKESDWRPWATIKMLLSSPNMGGEEGGD